MQLAFRAGSVLMTEERLMLGRAKRRRFFSILTYVQLIIQTVNTVFFLCPSIYLITQVGSSPRMMRCCAHNSDCEAAGGFALLSRPLVCAGMHMVFLLGSMGCGHPVAGVVAIRGSGACCASVPCLLCSASCHLCGSGQHARPGSPMQLTSYYSLVAMQSWGLLFIGFCIQAHAVTPWRNPEGASAAVVL
jgi:hypothetical protein